MPERLRDALDRLERALVANDWPVIRGLQPGLSEADVRRRLVDHDFDPPEDLLTVFAWHNGYEQPPDQISGWQGGWIGRAAYVLDLDTAMRDYLYVLGWIEEFEDDPEPRWFPVFGFANASLVINCGTDPETRGTVALWWPDGGFDEGTYRPRSLAEPVEWWAEWIETGATYWTINEAGGPETRSRLTRDQLTAEQLASDMHDV